VHALYKVKVVPNDFIYYMRFRFNLSDQNLYFVILFGKLADVTYQVEYFFLFFLLLHRIEESGIHNADFFRTVRWTNKIFYFLFFL